MKIKTKSKNQYKLLKLKLIKTKIYKKNQIFKFLSLEDIEHRLKKSLQIIYKYHINNKKILFISSFPILNLKLKNILKNTKHLFISQHVWLNKKLKTKQQFLSKKTLLNNILKIKKDLIVILDKLINTNIIKESYNTKTPIIFLGDNLNIFNNKLNYKIPGNFLINKKKINSNFFLTLLKIILKKKLYNKKYNAF